jgi:hypothetical protein
MEEIADDLQRSSPQVEWLMDGGIDVLQGDAESLHAVLGPKVQGGSGSAARISASSLIAAPSSSGSRSTQVNENSGFSRGTDFIRPQAVAPSGWVTLPSEAGWHRPLLLRGGGHRGSARPEEHRGPDVHAAGPPQPVCRASKRRRAADSGIWQKAIGIEPIGVLDTFFELGGDSVFGNQILVEINRALGVSIDPQRAFADFTIAALASLAEEQAVELLHRMTDEEAARRLDEA